jgi:hypothetical protein
LKDLQKNAVKLTNAVVATQSTDSKYIWDLIDPVYRFVLLNQSLIFVQWNVAQALANNQTKLNWDSIPANVQTILLTERTNNLFLNLTFLDWGWVNSNTDAFSGVTLFSLLSAQAQSVYANVSATLAPLTLNTLVNATLLRRQAPNRYCLDDLSNSVKNVMQFKGSFSKRDAKHSFFRPTPAPTPFNVVKRILQQAGKVVNTYKLYLRML